MKKIYSLILLAVLFCSCQREEERAEYIFLFIGDGMGLNSVIATEAFISYKATGTFESRKLTFTQFPYHTFSTTHSANHLVTDSAAGGTAIACGVKARNYTVGVDSEGKPVNSVAYELKQDGYNVGIISTAPINHATPSAFYAHSTDRFGYYDISSQIPDSGFDYFAGAGFMDYKGKDGQAEQIEVYLEKNGYTVCYGLEAFETEAAGKDRTIFCQESAKDGAADYVGSGRLATDMTLGDMLELGLSQFGDSEPFFFMCEGGKIDWSAHHNKLMPMMMDIIELDEAVAVAYDFYLKHPDETLIIVTADHETGGFALGEDHYEVDWELLESQWESAGGRNNLSPEENAAMNAKAKIGWTSRQHTAGPVPVFAVGRGAEKFSKRLSNIDFKERILLTQEKD